MQNNLKRAITESRLAAIGQLVMRLLVPCLLSAVAVRVHADCGAAPFNPPRTGVYQPQIAPIPPAPHNSLYITDPANQQYVRFDLDWGAQMASLLYDPTGNVLSQGQVNPNATELVWGGDPGGYVYWSHYR